MTTELGDSRFRFWLPADWALGAVCDRIEVDASTDQQASDEKLQPFTFALLPQEKLDACDFGSHTANHTRVNDDPSYCINAEVGWSHPPAVPGDIEEHLLHILAPVNH